MAAPPTEYELLRAKNIARNVEIMAELGVIDAAGEVDGILREKKRARSTPTKGLKSSPKLTTGTPPITMRRSLRAQGLPPSGIMDMEDKPSTARSELESLREYSRNVVDGPIKMESASRSNSNIGSLVSLLKDLRNNSAEIVESLEAKPASTNINELRFLPQNQNDVAKLVKDRIRHVEFLPFRNKCILIAGDKIGQVGLWDVDFSSTNEDDGDGVYTFNPHADGISGFAFSPKDGAQVYSCSFDGTIRQMNIDTTSWELLYKNEEIGFSSCCLMPGSKESILLGDKNGDIRVFDVREKKVVSTFECHMKKINSTMFSPSNEHMFVTSSTDANVALWDVRKMSKKKGEDLFQPVHLFPHSRAVNEACFSPNGQRLATTCYDDTIKIWSGIDHAPLPQLSGPVKLHHDNNTGRWISPFKAIWCGNDHVMIGGMKRCIDVFSASTKLHSTITSENMTTIPARLCVHPFLPAFAGGNASGKVHLWRKSP